MKPEEEWGPADHMAVAITFAVIMITIGVVLGIGISWLRHFIEGALP
jgi:hypothetical protein